MAHTLVNPIEPGLYRVWLHDAKTDFTHWVDVNADSRLDAIDIAEWQYGEEASDAIRVGDAKPYA